MKKYELMTIFPLEDEKSKKGAEDVKGTLTKFGAEIEEEKQFGDRDLTYEIKKQKRGRFVLYTMK
ncbi:MAG: 30S ribosomal protein S6, partial [Treponema sp.]|nr:30S ribosomal protein S6 [Treponema sp.]